MARSQGDIRLMAAVLVIVASPAARAQVASDHRLAFAHVSVVDVERGVARNDQTVVVVGNRIAEVGPAGGVTVPAGARVVDARGKYLIPGLWDMHAHGQFSVDNFTLHAAHGVTGIRHIGGPLAEAVAFRRMGSAELRAYPMRIRVGALSGFALDAFDQYPQFGGTRLVPSPRRVERPLPRSTRRAWIS